MNIFAPCAWPPSATPAFTGLLSTKIAELRSRIEDEVESRYIFSVSAVSADFLSRSRSILNPQVEAAFPDAIFDLLEASDCIGLSRYTAAVFHLMRAMEIALEKAGGRLGATVKGADGRSLPWGILIANLKVKIDQLKSDQEKEDWQAANAMLFSVKEAWRNGTMHPKQTYTEEEAIELFDAVRSFMRRLALLVG